MYFDRTIQKVLPQLSRNFKVILLTGMRQVGKSTVLRHLAQKEYAYVTLDSIAELDLAKNAPERFFEQHPLPIVIDEVQRAPGLFLPIKLAVDQSEQRGRVWLSGSHRFSLMKNVGDSLAGRLFELTLMPLSIKERLGCGLDQNAFIPGAETQSSSAVTMDSQELWHLIWQGAWPDVVGLDSREREQYFDAFLTTFLERDIKALSDVADSLSFRRFMQALALRTGQELRIGNLAQLTGVSQPTVKRWLLLAETCGLVYLLSPLFSNRNKTLVKSPKIYFTDTGLAAYLCGFTTAEEMRKSAIGGAFFETFALMEVMKSWLHNARRPDFYFLRDARTQKEIDLIIHTGGKYHPIEIKASDHPTCEMGRHFGMLKELGFAAGAGTILCTTDRRRILGQNIVAQSILDV